jgi:type IV secretory pathway component VirB8
MNDAPLAPDLIADAVSLHPDVRDIQYKEVRSYRARSTLLHRGYNRAGWTVACVFAATTVISLAGWCLFPTTVIKLVYMEHDKSTGWIGPAVGVHDAPATFGEKEAHAALSAYIYARERYTPEIDQNNWAQVRAMTAAQEWPTYAAWVDSKSAPKARLGRDGHVDIFNIVFNEPMKSADGTLTYAVRYNRREVRNAEITDPPAYTCTTQASFQWHPEIIQDETAARLNPYGMQVIAYKQPEPRPGC